MRRTHRALHDQFVENGLRRGLVQAARGQDGHSASVGGQHQRNGQRFFVNILEESIEAVHDEEYRQ